MFLKGLLFLSAKSDHATAIVVTPTVSCVSGPLALEYECMYFRYGETGANFDWQQGWILFFSTDVNTTHFLLSVALL